MTSVRDRSFRRLHRLLALDSEIFGVSVAKPERPKNEDAFVFRASASAWLLAVADGVSTCEKGQEAARLTVATLWKTARGITSQSTEALLAAVAHTHRTVRSRFNSNGLATLVAALVFPEQRRLVWASVGDSLLCVRDTQGFRQANPEDVETTLRQVNSETVLVDGIPVFNRRITQAIGIMGGIQPNTGVVEHLDPGSLVCLASDGVKVASLDAFLDRTDGFPELAAVDVLCSTEQEYSRDDTTVLLLRLGKAPAVQELENLLSAYESSEVATRLTIIECCERATWIPAGPLLRAFRSEREEVIALRLVSLLARGRPTFARIDLIPILEGAILAGQRRLSLQLSDVIRVLPLD